MIRIRRIALAAAGAALVWGAYAQGVNAARPTPGQALALRPIQRDVEFDVPEGEEVDKCSVEPKSGQGIAGWVVLDGGGQLLRRFLDTNGDNKVDHWCYYSNGVEVYRDLDTDFNGKADQYRWLGTAGIRWGLDQDEDGRIDVWKMISPEEVTSEVVAAFRTRDVSRFRRLLLSDSELRALGLGEIQRAEIAKKTSAAVRDFAGLAGRQKVITEETQWLHFGASHPGVVPAGFDGSTRDVIVYDNVSAIVENGGQHTQLAVGTMIQVGNAWRIIGLPSNLTDNQADAVAGGYFFQESLNRQAEHLAIGEGLSQTVQKLIEDLQRVDRSLESTTNPQELNQLNAGRADILEKLIQNAANAEDREMWVRQYADTVSAAVQSGGFASGVQRLQKLSASLRREEKDVDLIAHVEFLYLSADYSRQLQDPNADYPKIQEAWQQNLARFVKDYSTSEDAPEAMLQLAIGEEFAGKPDAAVQWYERVVQASPDSDIAKKAAGATRRLRSVGNTIQLSGRTLDNRELTLSSLRGKAVLIHYWATWCEPCKQDMQLLKKLQAKYARQGFTLLGVNLDSERSAATSFLRSTTLPWPHVYEPGGLESRLAQEMGILTLPTMILVDKQGKVINRNIHAAELDEELQKRLR
jgi:thiol-disulfide isomerase/thioredoxin